MGNVYESSHPLVRHKLTILRNKDTKPKKFRALIREISILLAYETTQDLALEPTPVETPMGKTRGSVAARANWPYSNFAGWSWNG